MTDKPKITNIDDARKRGEAQKNIRQNGASSGKATPEEAYQRALRKQKGGGAAFSGGGNVRWYHYIHLLLFLVLVAWLMKSCNI